MQAESKDKTCNCDCQCQRLDFTPLDAVLEEYKDLQGNLIIILQKAQEIYGYLPREVIQRISEKTGYTQAKIYGVATFYAQFRLEPIGKYLIMLCQGTACHVSGSQHIEKAIVDELDIKDGETTEDGLFTLNNVACLGCCSLAPVMMISTDESEETYGNLTPEQVVEIINKIREEEDAKCE
ncbi:MAG: NADH-quinone oxidoreductase subunit NuoE [Anaerovoracaceae bacterium]